MIGTRNISLSSCRGFVTSHEHPACSLELRRPGFNLSMRGAWRSLRWQFCPRRQVSTHSAAMTRTYEVCTLDVFMPSSFATMCRASRRSLGLKYATLLGCNCGAQFLADKLCDCRRAAEVHVAGGNEQAFPPRDGGMASAHWL